jgi:hypothetical protein
LAVTCVNTSAFFESPNFWELANELLDTLSPEYVKEVHEKILDQAYLQLEQKFDYGELRDLNSTPVVGTPNLKNITDPEGISEYKRLLGQFYGTA